MMSSFNNKNILVTGGTGFIGSHLVEHLIKLGAFVITTTQETNPRSYFITQKLDKKTVMVLIDLCDFEKTFELVTKFQIDYIFHLAAQPLVEVAYDNPKQTLYSNIIGTANILESARLFSKIKGVIVASSDKAYGKLKRSKYRETDALKGDHPYEASKASADIISSSYFKTYKVPVVIARFGNVYGEGDLNFSRIIPGIIKAVIKDELLEVRSDGNYIRDYLYVEDVVDGYLEIAKNLKRIKGEAFNFGSKDNLSVIEIIKIIEKVLDRKIIYKILNTAKNEIVYQSLNWQKAKKKLHWQPKTKFEQAIKKTFSWYKNYYFRT